MTRHECHANGGANADDAAANRVCGNHVCQSEQEAIVLDALRQLANLLGRRAAISVRPRGRTEKLDPLSKQR